MNVHREGGQVPILVMEKTIHCGCNDCRLGGVRRSLQLTANKPRKAEWAIVSMQNKRSKKKGSQESKQ